MKFFTDKESDQFHDQYTSRKNNSLETSRFKLHINLQVDSFKKNYQQINTAIDEIAAEFKDDVNCFKHRHPDWEENYNTLSQFYKALHDNDLKQAEQLKNKIKLHELASRAEKDFKHFVDKKINKSVVLDKWQKNKVAYDTLMEEGGKQYAIYLNSFEDEDEKAIKRICNFVSALEKKFHRMQLISGLPDKANSRLTAFLSLRQDRQADDLPYEYNSGDKYVESQEKSSLYKALAEMFKVNEQKNESSASAQNNVK